MNRSLERARRKNVLVERDRLWKCAKEKYGCVVSKCRAASKRGVLFIRREQSQHPISSPNAPVSE